MKSPPRFSSRREAEPPDEHRAEAPVYGRGSQRVERRGAAGRAGGVSIHARYPSVDVPWATVDDAPVRGLRNSRGYESPLQVPARAGPDGTLGGLRIININGLR